MADTFKVLAQLKPSSTTATTLYTVPRREGTGVNTKYPAQTTISSLVQIILIKFFKLKVFRIILICYYKKIVLKMAY